VTEENAKASGLMESIERYSSLPSTNSWRDFIRGSYNELSRKYKRSRILHLADVVESLRYEYKNDMIMDFLIGVDLFT
jgi:ribosomal protein S12 methylthiotransferase accessory factor